MNPTQLHQLILLKLKSIKPENQFTDLQDAILHEMCEHVINSKTVDHSNENEMILISLNSLDAAYTLMKGIITGLVESNNLINISYKDRLFSFDKNSIY